MNSNSLDKLYTLKSDDIDNQIATIKDLSQKYQYLYPKIYSALQAHDGNIIKVKITGEPLQLIRLFLLAIEENDINSAPIREINTHLKERFDKVCTHFGIHSKDLIIFKKLIPKLEELVIKRED